VRKWLKDLRKGAGFTIKGFAAHVGISATYYDKIERGERNVSVKVAKLIAPALGFEWQRFFE